MSRSQIVVMDEYGNVIPIDQAYQKGLEYEEKKFTTERISGSIIKAEIVKRSREQTTIVDFTHDE
jgi:hypothetical protein